MKTLEYFFERPPQINNFIPRRYTIKHPKTLIVGPSQCGKSFFVADFLNSLKPKSFLYLNLLDTRLEKENLLHLNKFIIKNTIETLVLENFNEKLDDFNAPNIILTSNNINLNIDGFTKLKLNSLDFEEFIGFNQRNFNEDHLFSLYANKGRFAKSMHLSSFENKIYLQEQLFLILKNELSCKLFSLFARHQATFFSPFEAYNELKKYEKISKDRIYKNIKDLQNLGLLHMVEKFNSPKSAKKIYLDNFAFKNALTIERDFMKRFENMIFCELLDEEVFYTNELHFYLPFLQIGILCIPFLPLEIIKRKFLSIIPKIKKLDIKNIKIITLNTEGYEKKDDIVCEIMPFSQWALS